MNIADKICLIRKNNSLSQEAFANIIGVSRQSVINWEKSKSIPEAPYLNIIASLYKIDINSLIDDNKEIIYLDEIINDDKLLYQERRTIICSKFIIFILFILFNIMALIFNIIFKVKYIGNYIFLIALIFIFIIIEILIVLSRKSYKILFYKNKYLLYSGLINKKYSEYSINKYNSCTINQDFLGGIFNYGNITIYYDNLKLMLGDVKKPYKLRDFLQNNYK